MLRLEWADAALSFGVLAAESRWSSAFYAYLEGSCHFHAGAHDKAATAFASIPAVARRSGPMGRPIPVEAFALRRASAYVGPSYSYHSLFHFLLNFLSTPHCTVTRLVHTYRVHACSRLCVRANMATVMVDSTATLLTIASPHASSTG